LIFRARKYASGEACRLMARGMSRRERFLALLKTRYVLSAATQVQSAFWKYNVPEKNGRPVGNSHQARA